MPNKKTRLTQGQTRDFQYGRTTADSPSGLGAHARELLERLRASKLLKGGSDKRGMEFLRKTNAASMKQSLDYSRKNAPKF